VLAIILVLQTLYNKLFGIALAGFTTVILLQLIIGSIIMLSLGVIGVYISKIYEEIKFRPKYIIAETAGELRKEGAPDRGETDLTDFDWHRTHEGED
jgi:hypothetical protein